MPRNLGQVMSIAWLLVFGQVASLNHACGAHRAIAIPASGSPAVTARWLGVAGLALTDGEATLLFDPVFTKPGLHHWLFGARFLSEVERVRRGLAEVQVKEAEAVFVSHTHFDHAIDAATIAHLTGAKIYGGQSLRRVTQKSQLPIRFGLVEDQQAIQIGKFKITMIRRGHAPVLRRIGWRFLEGEVPEDFDFGFYQFHEGEVWCYYVEHPAGNVLIDQGSEFFEPNSRYRGRVHTYFMGVANKRSTEDLIWGNIDRIRPKRVVPLHFDAFFLQASWLEKLRYLGPTLDEVRKRLEHEVEVRPAFLIPIVGQPIQIHR